MASIRSLRRPVSPASSWSDQPKPIVRLAPAPPARPPPRANLISTVSLAPPLTSRSTSLLSGFLPTFVSTVPHSLREPKNTLPVYLLLALTSPTPAARHTIPSPFTPATPLRPSIFSTHNTPPRSFTPDTVQATPALLTPLCIHDYCPSTTVCNAFPVTTLVLLPFRQRLSLRLSTPKRPWDHLATQRQHSQQHRPSLKSTW